VRNLFILIFSFFIFTSGFIQKTQYAGVVYREIASEKKIGVLFGTFDPPHIGHKNLALTFQKKFGLDIVYFIPRDKEDYKPGKQPIAVRNKLVELILEDTPSLQLVPAEIALKMKNIRSEEAFSTLRESFPKDQISLLLGDDTLMSLHKNQVHIPDNFQVLVSKRVGNEGLDLPKSLDGKPVFLMDVEGDSSSTVVRKVLAEGGVPDQLPDNVYRFIKKNKLYRPAPLAPTFNPKASCLQMISGFQ
jgi:nicotinate-nucleotide adenylyltransferase